MCWYKKGLYFKCIKCAKCCSGFPGYVWITKDDIENIAAFLKISKNLFLNKYTRYVNGLISLKEKKNFDCCFLIDKKCLIYSVRPKQCKKFPWWRDNLETSKAWNDLKKYCPGIDHKEGRFFSFKEIKKNLE